MSSAAIYSRLSRDVEGDMLGVGRQEEDCAALLRREGIANPVVFRDNSLSAWSKGRKRPGWDALIEAIRTGEIDTLAIYHPDRLVRQPRDLETLLDAAESRNLRLLSTGGGRDLSNPDDRFILRLEVAHACRSSDDSARRLRRKFQQMAEQGRPHGGPRPFGLSDDRMDLNQAEAAAVREIASRLLAGESLRSVTAWLNSTEFRPTGKGTSWSGPTVKQMVLRASIAGLRTHKGEIVGPTAHPAILDKDVWQSVVALLSDPARRRSHSSARTHLLSGLARCGKCQAGLRSTQVNGHRRYWCADCMGLAIAQEPLDLFITTAVLERIRTVKKPKRGGDQQVGTKILALRVRLDEIAERAVDPAAPLALLEKMAAKVTAELHSAETLQESLLSQQVLDAVDASVADRWDELPLSRRRAILDAVIESLVIMPSRGTGRFDVNRIEITWR